MNRYIILYLLLSAILLALTPAFGQTATTPTSTTQPSPDEQTILQLERELANAYNTGDTTVFKRIMTDDIKMILPSGRVQTKQRYLAAFSTVPSNKYEVQDMTVRVWGNTAVATGSLVNTYKKKNEQATRYSRRTDTFLKRENGWQLVASHNSPALWWQVRSPEDKQLTVLKPLPCSQEVSLRSSVEEDVRTYMKTTNNSDKPIISQFIDFDGKRHPTNKVTIEPGQSRDVYSFLNTVFVLTDANGKCLSLYQPIREPGLVVVK